MTTRNHSIDNVRLFLIMLVVLGHIIEPLIGNHVLFKTVYLFIYLFHIPLLVAISGYVASSNPSKEKQNKSIITFTSIIIVFTILFELFEFFLNGHFSKYIFGVVPYWILWYLYSLLFWRLLHPLVQRLPYPIITMTIVALLAGFFAPIGYVLGLSRTIYFFPFYLIGHSLKATPRHMFSEKFSSKWVQFLLLLLLIGVTYLCRNMNAEWLFGSYAYSHFAVPLWQGPIVRGSIYIVSAISSIVFFKLVADMNQRLAHLGRNTLYAYLWHGFIIKALVALGIIAAIGELHPVFGFTLSIVVAVALTTTLSAAPIVSVTNRFLLDPLQRRMTKVVHRNK